MKPPSNNRSGGPPRSGRGPFRSGGPNRAAGGGSRDEQRSPFRGADGQHEGRPRKPGGGTSASFQAGKPNRQTDRSHGGSSQGGSSQEGHFQPRSSAGAPSPATFSQRSHSQGGSARHGHDAPRHAPDAPKGTVWLYGHHAIIAALANPARRLRRLLLTEEAEAVVARQLPPPWALAPERVERGRLDQLLGRDIVHQGAALLADPLPPPSLQAVLERPGPVIVLDQVTDPRNVGAIMRSAAAFGAAAVITQDRNAPEETGALAKAASGALEKLPLLRAVNIARTLIALKAANVWCVGLDAAGKPLAGPDFAGRRVALVLGAEGEGLRRLTRETCDEVAGLTIKGAMESLNVSAAAAVALYELTRP